MLCLDYNERLTMPKMIAVGTGDQFFLPTGSNYFFDQLTGPKYMQYVQYYFYRGQIYLIKWLTNNILDKIICKVIVDNLCRVFENDDHGLGGHTDVLDHNVEALFISTIEVG